VWSVYSAKRQAEMSDVLMCFYVSPHQGRIQNFKLRGGRWSKGFSGWKSPSKIQGQSPGRGSGGWSPKSRSLFVYENINFLLSVMCGIFCVWSILMTSRCKCQTYGNLPGTSESWNVTLYIKIFWAVVRRMVALTVPCILQAICIRPKVCCI